MAFSDTAFCKTGTGSLEANQFFCAIVEQPHPSVPFPTQHSVTNDLVAVASLSPPRSRRQLLSACGPSEHMQGRACSHADLLATSRHASNHGHRVTWSQGHMVAWCGGRWYRCEGVAKDAHGPKHEAKNQRVPGLDLPLQSLQKHVPASPPPSPLDPKLMPLCFPIC